MTEPLDLDELERLLEKGTPRPWHPDFSQILGEDGSRVVPLIENLSEPYIGDPDTELGCAAVNALPALIQRLREAEAELDRLRNLEGIAVMAANQGCSIVTNTHLAQLERVLLELRDADANGLLRYALPEVHAALAALDEKP